MSSSSGRARSTSAASPPAMIVRVPSMALGADPVTGASTKWTPWSASRAPIARVCVGAIVLMSTNSAPGRAPWTAPSGSSSNSEATWSPSTTIEKTTSAAAAASRGVRATCPPCSAAHASAVAVVRL